MSSRAPLLPCSLSPFLPFPNTSQMRRQHFAAPTEMGGEPVEGFGQGVDGGWRCGRGVGRLARRPDLRGRDLTGLLRPRRSRPRRALAVGRVWRRCGLVWKNCGVWGGGEPFTMRSVVYSPLASLAAGGVVLRGLIADLKGLLRPLRSIGSHLIQSPVGRFGRGRYAAGHCRLARAVDQ